MANKNPYPFESLRTPYAFSGCKNRRISYRTGAQVAGPIPLPTERSLYTIIRATHKYKDLRIPKCTQTLRSISTQLKNS